MKAFLYKQLPSVCVLFFMVILFSCKDKQMHPDVSDIDVELNVLPFYQDIHEMDTMNIESEIKPIIEKYPAFIQAYSHRIVRLGAPESPDYSKRIFDFVTYQANKDIYAKSKEVFSSFDDFNLSLVGGFKHYKYYFPEMKIPDVYLMISGFSQSIAVDADWVGISIEKYLGQDCEFYEWLEIPKYLRKGMIKEKMAPDVLRAMALTNFTKKRKVDDLINNMVYQGKIRYFVHRMFPDIKDSLLFDYNAEQMLWCKNHEADMWASLVEWKHLFKEDRMMIQKYTGDAPFTSNFGNNSAPRAGEFIGYKIIEAYMKNNDQITFPDLMKETDGRKILAASNYRP